MRRKSSPLRWLITFGTTLGLLVALALYAHLRLPNFRDPPVDFRAMQSDEYFDLVGLTRRQEGSVKLGFAEHFPPPEIGAFGNHCIMHFAASAFGNSIRPGSFFNYFYANLSLPEIYYYLRHIENLHRLPTKLMIVAITAPNADNGGFIINHGNELPPDILLSELRGEAVERTRSIATNSKQFASIAWQLVENWLHETLNYNTFVLGLLQNGQTSRIAGPAICQAARAGRSHPAWLDRLPDRLRVFLATTRFPEPSCNPKQLWQTYLADGSIHLPLESRPVIDDDPLDATSRQLRIGDDATIARYLADIDAIGRRNGVNVVFIVPPVYEIDRDQSVVNQILDRAIASSPNLMLLDGRAMHKDPRIFVSTRHPNGLYFRAVANALRQRGLLNSLDAPAATARNR